MQAEVQQHCCCCGVGSVSSLRDELHLGAAHMWRNWNSLIIKSVFSSFSLTGVQRQKPRRWDLTWPAFGYVTVGSSLVRETIVLNANLFFWCVRAVSGILHWLPESFWTLSLRGYINVTQQSRISSPGANCPPCSVAQGQQQHRSACLKPPLSLSLRLSLSVSLSVSVLATRLSSPPPYPLCLHWLALQSAVVCGCYAKTLASQEVDHTI